MGKMKHVKDGLNKLLSKMGYNVKNNKYNNVKLFLESVMEDLKDVGTSLNYNDTKMINDIQATMIKVFNKKYNGKSE